MTLANHSYASFIAALLFVFLTAVFYATTTGISSSNDGSHYALTRTLVENRTFALRQFDDYAEGNDIAIRDDILYSDRPPGTAVSSAPLYAVAALLPNPAALLPSKHDAENPRLAYVMMIPALASAGTAVLLFLLLLRLQLSVTAASLTTLSLSLATAHWKYSGVLFSHALSGFLILAAVCLTLWLASARRPPSLWGYLLLGLILGYSVLVEYSNGLLVILLSLVTLAMIRPFSLRRLTITMGPFVGGGALSALFLAFYNWQNFGSPLTLSYAYAINYPWASEFATTFNYPLGAGLQALLVWGSGDGWCDGTCYNQGIFLLSPIFLLALPGLFLYFRRQWRVATLTTLIFIIYLLLFARHRTSHGFTADGRYLVPFLPLLMIPVGFWWGWLFDGEQWEKRPFWRPVALLFSFALLFLSVRNMVLHIGLSYNYSLDPTQLSRLVVRPETWLHVGQAIFPNAINVPLLLIPFAGLLLVGLLVWFGNRTLGEPGTAVSISLPQTPEPTPTPSTEETAG